MRERTLLLSPPRSRTVDRLEGRLRDQLLRLRRMVKQECSDGAELTRVRVPRTRAVQRTTPRRASRVGQPSKQTKRDQELCGTASGSYGVCVTTCVSMAN